MRMPMLAALLTVYVVVMLLLSALLVMKYADLRKRPTLMRRTNLERILQTALAA